MFAIQRSDGFLVRTFKNFSPQLFDRLFVSRKQQGAFFADQQFRLLLHVAGFISSKLIKLFDGIEMTFSIKFFDQMRGYAITVDQQARSFLDLLQSRRRHASTSNKLLADLFDKRLLISSDSFTKVHLSATMSDIR